MIKPRALIVCGDGINCDLETTWALELAGFEAARVHTSNLLNNAGQIFSAQLLAFPGGFSFGDEIASGKVLAVKIRHKMIDALHAYIDDGRLLLGICNGFQVLTQLGLLPFSDACAKPVAVLTRNAGGRFIDRWVSLSVNGGNQSPFFEGLAQVHLPVRHGEGRLYVDTNADAQTLASVKSQVALTYDEDVNGSWQRAAALSNPGGNVLGLMPHPEAFVRWSQHPAWAFWERGGGASGDSGDSGDSAVTGAGKRHPRFGAGAPDGLVILQNAARYLM